MMAYLLDSNIFIQAKNLHYGFEFCPAFWDWLSIGNDNGKVFSIEKVGDELSAQEDELSAWAIENLKLFLKPDDEVVEALGKVSDWTVDQNYEQAALNTFFQVADFYLVAHALAKQHVVVTHEVPSNSTKKIKIPNVCIGLKIKVMTPYEMLRLERAKFVLGS